jgi:hypothetical protein
MRATIDGVEIEGTPAEIAELLASLRVTSGAQNLDAPEPAATNPVDPDEGDEQVVTSQFAYRALRRIPLSASQRALFLALKAKHPKWTLASEIQEKMSWSGTQLGGVLGGLGRRLTATKGYKSGFVLWDWKWDDDEGQYAYRLPDAVLAALDRMDM